MWSLQTSPGTLLCVFGTIFSSISGKKNLIFLTENQHISSQDVGDIEIYFCDRKLGRLQLCLLWQIQVFFNKTCGQFPAELVATKADVFDRKSRHIQLWLCWRNWIMFWWTVGTISICHDESRRGGHTCRRLLVDQLKNSRKQHQDGGNRTDDGTETELKIGLKYKLIWGGGEVKVEWAGGTKRTEKELKGNSRRRQKQIKHKWNACEDKNRLLTGCRVCDTSSF